MIVTGATWYDELSKDKPAATTIKLLPVGADVSTSAWQSDKWTPETRMPRPHAPVMLPSDWEVLELTNPEAKWSPAPEAYLHGEREEKPRVAVAWRRDAKDAIADGLARYLKACPFAAAECAEVPVSEIRPWLKSLPDDLWTAVEGRDIVPAVSWDRVGPQHTLLVDGTAGGLRDGTFDSGTRGKIDDVWETAYEAAIGRPVVRIRDLLREEHRQSVRRMVVERDNGFQPGSLALVELGIDEPRKGFWLAEAARDSELSGDAEPPLLSRTRYRSGRPSASHLPCAGHARRPDGIVVSGCTPPRRRKARHPVPGDAEGRRPTAGRRWTADRALHAQASQRQTSLSNRQTPRICFGRKAVAPRPTSSPCTSSWPTMATHAPAQSSRTPNRPTLSPTFASAADLELVKVGQPQRFAELLEHHGGGLLRLLEAILVTADRQVAAEEDERWS